MHSHPSHREQECSNFLMPLISRCIFHIAFMLAVFSLSFSQLTTEQVNFGSANGFWECLFKYILLLPKFALSWFHSLLCSGTQKLYILILDIILELELPCGLGDASGALFTTLLQILSNILPALKIEVTPSTGLPIHIWALFFSFINPKTKIQMFSAFTLPRIMALGRSKTEPGLLFLFI